MTERSRWDRWVDDLLEGSAMRVFARLVVVTVTLMALACALVGVVWVLGRPV